MSYIYIQIWRASYEFVIHINELAVIKDKISTIKIF